jgi:hypothetical protein
MREVYGVRPCRCGPNGVDTISVNEHTDYVTVTLDASAMSLVAGMNPYGHTVSASSRAKPCYPDGRSNPGKREGKSTFRFKPSRISSIRQYLVTRMVIHSREANHCPIGTGPVTHGRYAMYSRAIPGSRGWPREGRLQNLPAHRPCSLKTAARLAAPSSRAVFLESKFPNPARRPFVRWERRALPS